jgi:hypothetical protein
VFNWAQKKSVKGRSMKIRLEKAADFYLLRSEPVRHPAKFG